MFYIELIHVHELYYNVLLRLHFAFNIDNQPAINVCIRDPHDPLDTKQPNHKIVWVRSIKLNMLQKQATTNTS